MTRDDSQPDLTDADDEVVTKHFEEEFDRVFKQWRKTACNPDWRTEFPDHLEDDEDHKCALMDLIVESELGECCFPLLLSTTLLSVPPLLSVPLLLPLH